MYIFTLWNQSPMPDRYAACIVALQQRYPSLVVRMFDSPDGVDPRLTSDRIRLEILAETTGDALYVDADCIPGPSTWVGADRCCAFNCRGGFRDTSVLYKPAGAEVEVMKALESGKCQDRLYFPFVQGWGVIHGYPNDEYFTHHGYSTQKE